MKFYYTPVIKTSRKITLLLLFFTITGLGAFYFAAHITNLRVTEILIIQSEFHFAFAERYSEMNLVKLYHNYNDECKSNRYKLSKNNFEIRVFRIEFTKKKMQTTYIFFCFVIIL